MSDQRFLQQGFEKQLSHVIEECGEVLAAAGKLQRWGKDSVNPLLPKEQQETNLAWLIRELADCRDAIERLEHTIGMDFLRAEKIIPTETTTPKEARMSREKPIRGTTATFFDKERQENFIDVDKLADKYSNWGNIPKYIGDARAAEIAGLARAYNRLKNKRKPTEGGGL